MHFLEQIGEGAFGEVWKAEDDLGRTVAIKLFKESGQAISTALDHARALARVDHPNVVRIHHITKVRHPGTGEELDCVVMELLPGQPLDQLLSASRVQLSDARVLGLGIIEGMKAIHHAGLAHGDLHDQNIIVTFGQPKIIDILYRGTLAAMTPRSREQRIQSDLNSIRLILADILHHTTVDPGEATQFNNQLASDSSFGAIRTAWLRVTDPSVLIDEARLVQHAMRRLEDQSYVEGEPYANALADEIPSTIAGPVLLEVIRRGIATKKHTHHCYVSSLDAWGRARDGGFCQY